MNQYTINFQTFVNMYETNLLFTMKW